MRLALFLLAATLTAAGEFTTSLGDAYPYTISAITTDAVGNTYVVGGRGFFGDLNNAVATIVPNIAVGTQPAGFGGSGVFITKLDPNGKVIFTDLFGGDGWDRGFAIALDPSGNIYIAGATTSDDFPLSKALQRRPETADGTGFIIKLSNDGTTILYSTYFGGTLGETSIASLATDAKGNLYLTGTTAASDFPHTTGMPLGPVSPTQTGAFIASISAAGDKILYSGTLAGTNVPCVNGTCYLTPTTAGVGIAVDAVGNAYVAGNTDTTDLWTTAGVLSPKGIGAFVAKVNSTGSGLAYLTYLGTGVIDADYAASSLSAIPVDAAGNAYLAGQTDDPQFPTTPGSYQQFLMGNSRAPGPVATADEGFIAKLKPDGSAMVWATFLGTVDNPSYGTETQSLAIDVRGNVWVTGNTATSNFPNTQGWTTGGDFVVALNASGAKLTYAALYPNGTVDQAIVLDPSGLVHVAGTNGFVSAIATAPPPTMKIFGFGNVAGSDLTARISPAEIISIYGPGIGPATASSAAPAGGFYPTTLSGVQVTMNGSNIPLLYVSANQINAIVPMGRTIGAGATVRVINGTTPSPDYPVWIVDSADQAFPAVLNQDGTLNSQSNPAKGGSVVTFYATGWQSNFSPLADGQIATVAQDQCAGMCQAYLDDSPALVLYAGPAPGLVAGMTQFNVQLGSIQEVVQANLQLSGSGPAPNIDVFLWVTP
jgi:uncharacterized protein (TIGR03437 family)